MDLENRKTKASGLPRMEVSECTDKIRITEDGEAYYGITKKAAMDEASRCLHCPRPRCQTGCPNHINIPDFIFEIANGNVAVAAKKLAEVSQEEDKQAAAEKIIEENFDVLSFNCPEFKTLVNNGKTKELAQIIISFSVTE